MLHLSQSRACVGFTGLSATFLWTGGGPDKLVSTVDWCEIVLTGSFISRHINMD